MKIHMPSIWQAHDFCISLLVLLNTSEINKNGGVHNISYEQSEPWTRSMARERASLRGGLGKRKKRAKRFCLAPSQKKKKKNRHSHIKNLGQREKGIAGRIKM